MGFDVDIKLTGVDRVSRALQDAQKTLKRDTVPVIKAAADTIARGAQSRAVPHPSGLYRMRGRASSTPQYRVQKKGEYLFSVYAVGAGEAISEFARLSTTTQGAAMVNVLDGLYGRGGGSGNGRILWATVDDMEDGLVEQIYAAVDVAAKDIEKQMGSA